MLTSLLALTLLGLPTVGKAQEGEKGVDRSAEISELIEVIQNDSIRDQNPERVVKAIRRLGELRAVEAVEPLVRLLTFRKPRTEKGYAIYERAYYPARTALYSIGKAAVPKLVQSIAEHGIGSVQGLNAFGTLVSIYGKEGNEREEGLLRVKEALSKAEAQKERQNLAEAVRKYEELISKTQRQ